MLRIAIGALVVILFGFVSLLAIVLAWRELPFMGAEFTQSAWADVENCATDYQCEARLQKCERGAMYRTLAGKHLVLGKTSKSDVLQLLGDTRDIEVGDRQCLRYLLGYCSGLGMDIDYLQVCFDGTQTLISKNHFQG